jgi:hypothetical protein
MQSLLVLSGVALNLFPDNDTLGIEKWRSFQTDIVI